MSYISLSICAAYCLWYIRHTFFITMSCFLDGIEKARVIEKVDGERASYFMRFPAGYGITRYIGERALRGMNFWPHRHDRMAKPMPLFAQEKAKLPSISTAIRYFLDVFMMVCVYSHLCISHFRSNNRIAPIDAIHTGAAAAARRGFARPARAMMFPDLFDMMPPSAGPRIRVLILNTMPAKPED